MGSHLRVKSLIADENFNVSFNNNEALKKALYYRRLPGFSTECVLAIIEHPMFQPDHELLAYACKHGDMTEVVNKLIFEFGFNPNQNDNECFKLASKHGLRYNLKGKYDVALSLLQSGLVSWDLVQECENEDFHSWLQHRLAHLASNPSQT